MITRTPIWRRRRTLAIVAAVAAVCGLATAQAAGAPSVSLINPFGTDHVGTQADGRVLLPTNQYVSPAGQRITMPAEVAGATLSPDGTHVAVQLGGISGKDITLLDADTGAVVQRFGGSGTAAPFYSPDGTALFATQSGSIRKYAVASDGLITNPNSPAIITMPNDGLVWNPSDEIDGSHATGASQPLGMSSSPDGTTLYVAENGSNALDVINTAKAPTPPAASSDGTHAASDAIAPVLSYNFNNDSGATATDTSGNANDGSWAGDPAYVTGVDGQAAHVSAGHNVKLPLVAGKTDASGSFSFEFWLKANSYTGDSWVFDNSHGGSCADDALGIFFNTSSNGVMTGCYTTAAVHVAIGNPPLVGSWHQVAGVVDRTAGTVIWYVDGAQSGPITSIASNLSVDSGLPFVLGQNGAVNYGSNVDGLYDDVNFYDQAIPATQVADDYFATCAPVGCTSLPLPATHTQIPVGNVPADVVVADGKAYVSNRGGAIAKPGQATNSSAGAAIVINKQTNAPASGTVSVIDLATDKLIKTINVGLQPAAMTVHDGAVFVANTASDTISVIDTRQDRVAQTVNVEPLPGSTVGAAPNAITFAHNTMLVSVGRDNAIAQYAYRSRSYPIAYQGLIPTDSYPNSVAYDAKFNKVFVANETGISSDGANSTYAVKGTVTDFTPPSYQDLDTLTKQVFTNNGWDKLTQPATKNQKNVAPVAIPKQLGQPSKIKHVILIDRENRAYDEIFGDIGKGNGDPAYSNLGEPITPNAHAIANQFSLFDNFYDNGMLSADGHNWLLQANNNDYLEQDAATFWYRSYPDLGGDELQYQTSGSIWNAAERAGLSVKNYGEQVDYETGRFGTFQQYWADSQIMEGKAGGPLQAPPLFDSGSDNASLNAITDHSYPGWSLLVPDQYRVDIWEKAFAQQVKTNTFPNLTILYLPNDHTGGNGSGQTGNAQVADNDLATGRVIDDLSHSKYWKSSAVFSVEDDSQALGHSDHVDGHRAPLLAASPYLKHDAIDSSYYSQINVTKTIEQILGIQPMNQLDRAAVPMFDAFTNTPDLTPYDAVPAQTPITQGVSNLIPLPPAAGDSAAVAKSVEATSGPAAPPVPVAEQSMAATWAAWSRSQTPLLKQPDRVNPPQFSRYDWYTSTDWSRPYPGDRSILAPDQVPGRNVPGGLTGDH